MTQNIARLSFAIAFVTLSWNANAHAGWSHTSRCYVRQQTQVTTQTTSASTSATASDRVIYKVVQQTPQYDIARPEVVSGARVTLFANFLRQETGCVLFLLNGTSTECNLIEWKPNSVTVDLPKLGLAGPKNAEIQIVLPDGRVAKTFPVLFISQPDIVIHEDTVPQPMPPAPVSRPAMYVEPVNGGLVLTAGAE